VCSAVHKCSSRSLNTLPIRWAVSSFELPRKYSIRTRKWTVATFLYSCLQVMLTSVQTLSTLHVVYCLKLSVFYIADDNIRKKLSQTKRWAVAGPLLHKIIYCPLKTFWKSVNNWQSYEECTSVTPAVSTYAVLAIYKTIKQLLENDLYKV